MSKSYHVALIPFTTGVGSTPDSPAKQLETQSSGLSRHLTMTCGQPVTVYALWRQQGDPVPSCTDVVAHGYPVYLGRDIPISWDDLDTGINQDPSNLYFAAIVTGGDIRIID